MIKRIVTHYRPHADELIALIFLKNFPEGEEKFPGVKTASIEFLSTGKLPLNKTYKDFPDSIFLGVGSGPFDEHETSSQERAKGEVCATLVAKALGIEGKPELQGILNVVRNEDLNVATEKDALSIMIKFLHSCFKDDADLIYKWAEIAYLAHIRLALESGAAEPFTLGATKQILKSQNHPESKWFEETINKAILHQHAEFQKAQSEFDQNSTVWRVKAYDEKPVSIAFIKSDNEEMGKAARSRGLEMIIQKNSRGNVFIFTNRKRGLNLSSVIALLRLAEQHFAGNMQVSDTNTLCSVGMIADIPWYLFYTRDMIFNGSLTTKDIPPTQIPEEKMIQIILEGIQKNFQ